MISTLAISFLTMTLSSGVLAACPKGSTLSSSGSCDAPVAIIKPATSFLHTLKLASVAALPIAASSKGVSSGAASCRPGFGYGSALGSCTLCKIGFSSVGGQLGCDPCSVATTAGTAECIEPAPFVKVNNIPASSTTTSRSVILLATPFAIAHNVAPSNAVPVVAASSVVAASAPVATPRILISQIMIVGCPNYKAPPGGSKMIGGDTCTPTLLSSTGEGVNLGSPDAAQFSFNALNGTCSGIEMPITLTAVGSTTSTFSNTTFTLDCTNPAYPQLHLAQPAQNHFCMSPQSDKANSKFYVTSDMACSNTNRFMLTFT